MEILVEKKVENLLLHTECADDTQNGAIPKETIRKAYYLCAIISKRSPRKSEIKYIACIPDSQ